MFGFEGVTSLIRNKEDRRTSRQLERPVTDSMLVESRYKAIAQDSPLALDVAMVNRFIPGHLLFENYTEEESTSFRNK